VIEDDSKGRGKILYCRATSVHMGARAGVFVPNPEVARAMQDLPPGDNGDFTSGSFRGLGQDLPPPSLTSPGGRGGLF